MRLGGYLKTVACSWGTAHSPPPPSIKRYIKKVNSKLKLFAQVWHLGLVCACSKRCRKSQFLSTARTTNDFFFSSESYRWWWIHTCWSCYSYMTWYTCGLILLKGIDPNCYIHVNILHLSVNFCSPFILNCQQYTHDRKNSNNTHTKGILRIISEWNRKC